jgi:hypothetical protein
MNKSLFFLGGILAIIVVSGCAQTGQITSVDTGPGTVKECPASCDDGNECTADLCDENSDFECRNVPRWGTECGENGFCSEGVCVERTDNCSDTLETEEREDCYFREYFIPARRNKNVLVCDGISDNVFIGRCYAYVGLGADDPVFCEGLEKEVSRDECYAFYAESKAEIFIFAEEACEKIVNPAMKAECLALEEIVTAPVGIRDFDAEVGGDKRIYAYFTLKDMKGRITTAAGTATILITREDEKEEGVIRLVSKTYDVEEDDFEMFRPGLGSEELSFVIPPINPEDFEAVVTGRSGTFFLTFAADDGKYFYKQKELDFLA